MGGIIFSIRINAMWLRVFRHLLVGVNPWKCVYLMKSYKWSFLSPPLKAQTYILANPFLYKHGIRPLKTSLKRSTKQLSVCTVGLNLRLDCTHSRTKGTYMVRLNCSCTLSFINWTRRDSEQWVKFWQKKQRNVLD